MTMASPIIVPNFLYSFSFLFFSSSACFICLFINVSVISIWLIWPSTSVIPNSFDKLFSACLSSWFKLFCVSSTAFSQALPVFSFCFCIFSFAFLNICDTPLIVFDSICLNISGIGSYENLILLFNMFNAFFSSSNSSSLSLYFWAINFRLYGSHASSQ